MRLIGAVLVAINVWLAVFGLLEHLYPAVVALNFSAAAFVAFLLNPASGCSSPEEDGQRGRDVIGG